MKTVFIAVKVKPVREILEIRKELKKMLANERIGWVREDHLHITIKYIGNVTPEQLEEIENCLEQAGGIHAMNIQIINIGFFWRGIEPYVMWIGVQNHEHLKQLFILIDESLKNIGVERETRGFLPHITIGRIKPEISKTLIRNLERKYREIKIVSYFVQEICLIESIQSVNGVEYHELKKVTLS